jgi:hypothetical protein
MADALVGDTPATLQPSDSPVAYNLMDGPLGARLLGMSLGKAGARLRKAILFALVQRLDEDVCFRCGKKIENIDEFSIDHKEAWRNSADPLKMFFSLENIAFSHFVCNSAAATRNKIWPDINAMQRAGYWRLKDTESYRRRLARKRARRVTISCPECGEEFQRTPSYVAGKTGRNERLFCSRSCRTKFSNHHRSLRNSAAE